MQPLRGLAPVGPRGPLRGVLLPRWPSIARPDGTDAHRRGERADPLRARGQPLERARAPLRGGAVVHRAAASLRSGTAFWTLQSLGMERPPSTRMTVPVACGR